MFFLPGNEEEYILKLSLYFVLELESEFGSLYTFSEKFLEGALEEKEINTFLKSVYRHAGCMVSDKELDVFTSKQDVQELLPSILLEIMDPIDRLGAIVSGEMQTAHIN